MTTHEGGVDADAVEQRARIDHYQPPVHGLDEPLWIAEDPETDCRGMGRVRLEAVGNLVAVVAEHEPGRTARTKLPGESVRRHDLGSDSGSDGGLLGGLADLF